MDDGARIFPDLNVSGFILFMFFNGRTKNALRWVLDNLKLRSPAVESTGGFFVVLYVQSPLSIAAGIEGADPSFLLTVEHGSAMESSDCVVCF